MDRRKFLVTGCISTIMDALLVKSQGNISRVMLPCES